MDLDYEGYFKSLSQFGYGLKEFISDLTEGNPEIDFVKKDELFYAKSFFDPQDKGTLYFFGKDKVTMVKYIFREEIRIKREKYKDIIGTTTTLGKEEIEIYVKFKSGSEFTFNNMSDSNGNWGGKHKRKITEIHNLINE